MRISNIEEPDGLLNYLGQAGLIDPDERPEFCVLSGGVSNRTVWVRRAKGDDMVLKQALDQLRVATEWKSDPRRSHREALGLRWLSTLTGPGRVPKLRFEDEENHLLAMDAVPQPHTNWKSDLLAGKIDAALAVQFGRLLGDIHRRAFESREVIAPIFDDRSYFRSLRLEPYYEYAAGRNSRAGGFMRDLLEETEGRRETLVHGDYSPKNTLVHCGKLVLLDHEVIHWGDPAFDLGFSLTHFIGKANHFGASGIRFLNAAKDYWSAYRDSTHEAFRDSAFEQRAVRHTLACALARVDGRSPLEYLTKTHADRQRHIALELMSQLPGSVGELLNKICFELGCER